MTERHSGSQPSFWLRSHLDLAIAVADLQHQVRAILLRLNGFASPAPAPAAPAGTPLLKRIGELQSVLGPIFESRWFQGLISFLLPAIMAGGKMLWRWLTAS